MKLQWTAPASKFLPLDSDNNNQKFEAGSQMKYHLIGNIKRYQAEGYPKNGPYLSHYMPINTINALIHPILVQRSLCKKPHEIFCPW